MIKEFKVANYNQVDSVGDVFLPGCFKDKRVLVLQDFDVHKPIGFTEAKVKEDGVYAELNVDDRFKGLWYPAIGFQIIKSREENGVRLIEEVELYAVSINSQPNADPTIPPLTETPA